MSSTLNFVDLAQRRRIVVRQGSATVGYLVRPVSQEEWFTYFDGIVSTSTREGKQVVTHNDASSAGIDLVESLIEGPGIAPSPLPHKLAIANVLTSAYVPSAEESAFQEPLGPEAVRVWTVWGAAEDGDAMRRFKNLVHFFSPPTSEHYRRYRRDDSRAQIISGSRKGTTVYRGAQRTLAALYDELIISVAGYAVNGVALTGTLEIRQHMDTYHKVTAALGLFGAGELAIEDEEEE